MNKSDVRTIAIVDIQWSKYVYASTRKPSRYTALISGYYKSQNCSVSLITDFESLFNNPEKVLYHYDKVFFINEDRYQELYTPSEFLQASKTYHTIGKGYSNDEWETSFKELEDYPPDLTIYHNFIDTFLEKYDKYSPYRFDAFYMKPFLINRNGKKHVLPEEPVLVLDNDLYESIDILSEAHAGTRICYPVRVKNAEELQNTLDCFNLRQIYRDDFWVSIDYNDLVADKEEIKKVLKETPNTRHFRIKLELCLVTQEEWLQELPKVVELIVEFLENGKRLQFYPYNHFNCSEELYSIIIATKRWTGKRSSTVNNSLISYILLDYLNSYERIARYLFVKDKRSITKSNTLLGLEWLYDNHLEIFEKCLIETKNKRVT